MGERRMTDMENKTIRIRLGGNKRGSAIRGYAIVDELDADLARFSWCLAGEPGYAARKMRRDDRRFTYLRRLILIRSIGRDLEAGEVCDHINGDPLDNRRCNLRVADLADNSQNRGLMGHNTSGYTGVTKCRRGRWQVCVTVRGKAHYRGSYTTPEAAAKVVAELRKELGSLAGQRGAMP